MSIGRISWALDRHREVERAIANHARRRQEPPPVVVSNATVALVDGDLAADLRSAGDESDAPGPASPVLPSPEHARLPVGEGIPLLIPLDREETPVLRRATRSRQVAVDAVVLHRTTIDPRSGTSAGESPGARDHGTLAATFVTLADRGRCNEEVHTALVPLGEVVEPADAGDRVLHDLVRAFASGRAVMSSPDSVSDRDAARMARARRTVHVIRPPRPGDCLEGLVECSEPTPRECRRVDGAPKHCYPRKSEAKRVAAIHRARGEEVHVYLCTTCGTHHVGHHRPRPDDARAAS